MIIELFGLPGSGKSFYCNQLEQNNFFKDIMKFYRENFFGKVLLHLVIEFCLLDKKFKKIYKDIFNFINDNNVNVLSGKNDIELYVKYMIFIYFIEVNKKKKNIIIDEGIVHYCMVLYAEYSVEMEKCIKILEYFDSKKYKDCKKVYRVSCDIETAIIRSKKRNRKRAPIDFIEGKQLYDILSRYNDFIKNVSYRYEVFKLKELEKKND